MQILSSPELRAFQTPPPLNAAQRKSVFDLPAVFQKAASHLRHPAHKIGFWLNAGYFRQVQRCFLSGDFPARDVAFVSSQLGLDAGLFHAEDYSERTLRRHCRLIERLSGFRPQNPTDEATLAENINLMVAAHEKPKTILFACLEKLTANKITSPTYGHLQNLILSAISRQRARQTALIEAHLTPSLRNELDALLKEGDAEEGGRRPVTLYKRHSQSIRPAAVKERVDNHVELSKLFQKIEPIMALLDWNQNNVQVYAGTVIKSNIKDLRRRKPADLYLHLIAFVASQFYALQDNLVATILNSVRGVEAAVTREHKEWCYSERKSQAAKLKAQIEDFEDHFRTAMGQLLAVFEATDLTDSDKLASLRLMLFPANSDTAPVLSQNLLAPLKSGADSTANDDARYFDILEAKSRRLQNQVSGALKALSLQAETNVKPLFQGLTHFQKTQGQVNKSAPTGFLSADERAAVGQGADFRPSLYKVFLFQHVAGAIKSGSVNLPKSQKYQPVDGYMIGLTEWQRDREALLAQAGMTRFSNAQDVLDGLKAALEKQFSATDANIKDGSNKHFKRLSSGKFTVATPKKEDADASAVALYLPRRHYVPVTEILSTVNAVTGFADNLDHLRPQYARVVPKAVLFAGVIGMGCGIGLRKMARISGTIKADALDNAATWHLSLDNLLAANDSIVAFTEGLDLPEVYLRQKGVLHSASDGQKFEVSQDSLNASYSYKYFGKDQGSSAYGFIDDRSLLWYSTVFSAAERESAYVIDGLMHNDVVKTDIHSTDTHGFSEAIFCATHFLEIYFAPRIKNLKRQTLYGFHSTAHEDRKAWAVRPTKYIDEATIVSHWDEILRLIVTIKLKRATASDIFRRLNSYSKQNSLYTALKAFGRIIKTLFILRYIDDVELRMSIEGQLNKIELANKLTRAISVGSPRDYIYAHEEEQKIAEACNRLIKNAIICWNYMYLEKRLKNADAAGQAILLKAIKTHSPMSWGHINMLGEYDFSEEKMADNHGLLPPKIGT